MLSIKKTVQCFQLMLFPRQHCKHNHKQISETNTKRTKFNLKPVLNNAYLGKNEK